MFTVHGSDAIVRVEGRITESGVGLSSERLSSVLEEKPLKPVVRHSIKATGVSHSLSRNN
jgi:hypothetical protein